MIKTSSFAQFIEVQRVLIDQINIFVRVIHTFKNWELKIIWNKFFHETFCESEIIMGK